MILFDCEEIPKELKGSVIAIGNFDGVHIGHQEIIKTARSIARSKDVKMGVVTFDPHPSSVLGKADDHKLLMSVSRRAAKLLEVGADFVLIVRFTHEFASLTAKDFIDNVLASSLGASHVVTGYNFRFGARGLGNTTLMAQQAKLLGFGFTQVNHIKYLGQEVSTSCVKQLIASGRILMAASLLGEEYDLPGIVGSGKRMAASILGTPTANIEVGSELQLPLFGVYLVKAKIDSEDFYYGIANIGLRPTVDNASCPRLEVHFYDLDRDLYGQTITAKFLSFIRPERKFNGIDELKYAIASDKAFGRYLCRNAPTSLVVKDS